jgi:hypothetical protein
MIEIFKTNVRSSIHAKMLVSQIHTAFGNYEANFDLDDCDNILRIKSISGTVQASRLIAFLKDFGFNAEVLEDKCFTR